jgi:hypothetical protein
MHDLPSYNHCLSEGLTGFVHLSDFVAMAINYSIEKEMENETFE